MRPTTMYIPRTPLRRRAPWIAVAVAAIAGGGAVGLAVVPAGGHAVAAVSPVDTPTVAPSPTPVPSLPPFTPAVNTGWELPSPDDPLLIVVAPTRPRPRVTPTHTPRPTTTPSPKPTTTSTPSPKPPATPPPPTCTYDGRTYTSGEKRWGPADGAGHRIQYVCSPSNPDGSWVALPRLTPQDSCTAATQGRSETLDDGYTYYCANGSWTDTPPPASSRR
jgi:hypothetical protein